jgi:hypothetical protein
MDTDSEIIADLDAAADVLKVHSAATKRKQELRIPVPATSAVTPNFRMETDDRGHQVLVHTGMNRKQRMAALKQRELELRGLLKKLHRHAAKSGKLPSEILAIDGIESGS